MSLGPAVELSSDCTACGLESGVIELYDALSPATRFGLPAATRCKLCSVAHEARFDREPARPMREIPANLCPACLLELGPRALDAHQCLSCGASARLFEIAASKDLSTEAALARALDAWAEQAMFPSREELLAATFCDPDFATLLVRIQQRVRLEVLADPFGPAPMRPAAPTTTTVVDAPPATARPTAPPPPSAPPRAIVYPLVSVIAADGEIHPAERALIDRFLVNEGLAPLADHEFAVHHPSAVAHLVPVARRRDVVQLMCETAAVDGMPDESERRVIRAYAAAWDVPDEIVEFWLWGYENMNTSLVRQLWMKLRRFVLSARWGDPTEPTFATKESGV